MNIDRGKVLRITLEVKKAHKGRAHALSWGSGIRG